MSASIASRYEPDWPRCKCGHTEVDHHGFEEECLVRECLCIEWKAAS